MYRLSIWLICLLSLTCSITVGDYYAMRSGSPVQYQVNVGKKGSIFKAQTSLDTQPNHHIFSVDYSKSYPFDSKWLRKKLLPGDLVFFEIDPQYFTLKTAIQGSDGEEIDYAILTFQRLMNKAFNLGYTDDSSSFVHIGIYLGDGQILESSPVTSIGLRKISIDDPDFVLCEDDPEAYKIYRIQSEKLRRQVALIANEFDSYSNIDRGSSLQYSYKSAFLSLFPINDYELNSSYLFTPKKGAHEPLILDHLFCSYLVVWIIQASEYQLGNKSQAFISDTALSYSPSALYQLISKDKSLFKEVGHINPIEKLNFTVY